MNRLVCILILLSGTPGLAAREELAAERYDLHRLVVEEQYGQAMELGRRLREETPFDADTLMLLGEALVARAEEVTGAGTGEAGAAEGVALLEEAEEVLARAARLRPTSLDAWKLLGYSRFQQEDSAGAAAAMREAARIAPRRFIDEGDGAMAFLFFAEMDTAPSAVYMAVALLVVLFSVILHELAHAGSASLLGDPTSGALGRLTLNPLAHVDPIGTVMLPLLLVATQAGIVFGYARPVPFWPENFRHPRLYRILTALAGPTSNLVILAGCVLLGRGLLPWLVVHDHALWPVHVLFLAGMINALLALLNALPIFPLDGGHLIATFLPPSWGPRAESRLAILGIVLILLVIQSGAWDQLIDGLQMGMTMAFGL